MNDDLIKGYPGTPPCFHDAMKQTLMEVEHMKQIRRHKLRTMLCAALIGALLLTGVAYAAVVRWGIMESPFIEPLETARGQVQMGLGFVEDDMMRATVTEAAFDGVALHMAIEFEPKHPDRVVLAPDGEDTFEIDGVIYESNVLEYRKIAEQTGRELVQCPVNLALPQFDEPSGWPVEGQIGELSWHGHTTVRWSIDDRRVDEKLVYRMESLVIPSPLPEGMEVVVECLGGRRIVCNLEQTRPSRAVDLVPRNAIRGMDVASAQLIFTDFATYLDVFYTTDRTQRNSDLWAVELIDPDGVWEETHHEGGMDVELSPGGHAGTRYRTVYAAQTNFPQELRLRFQYDGQAIGEAICDAHETEVL